MLERTLASLHGLRFKFVRTDACDADVKGKMPPSPATSIADYVRAPLYALCLTVLHGTPRPSTVLGLALRVSNRRFCCRPSRCTTRGVATKRTQRSLAAAAIGSRACAPLQRWAATAPSLIERTAHTRPAAPISTTRSTRTRPRRGTSTSTCCTFRQLTARSVASLRAAAAVGVSVCAQCEVDVWLQCHCPQSRTRFCIKLHEPDFLSYHAMCAGCIRSSMQHATRARPPRVTTLLWYRCRVVLSAAARGCG